MALLGLCNCGRLRIHDKCHCCGVTNVTGCVWDKSPIVWDNVWDKLCNVPGLGALWWPERGDGWAVGRGWAIEKPALVGRRLGGWWVGGGCSVNHAGDGGKPLAVSVSLFGAGLCFCPLLGDALGGAAFVGV